MQGMNSLNYAVLTPWYLSVLVHCFLVFQVENQWNYKAICFFVSLCRPIPCPEPVKLQIFRVAFSDYEKHCCDLLQLRETCEYEMLNRDLG